MHRPLLPSDLAMVLISAMMVFAMPRRPVAMVVLVMLFVVVMAWFVNPHGSSVVVTVRNNYHGGWCIPYRWIVIVGLRNDNAGDANGYANIHACNCRL